MADKAYLKCSCKAKTFDDGGTILRLSFKDTDIAEFVRTHKNEKGYVNLIIRERKEPGTYGDTHAVYLDDWKPRS